MGTRETYRTTLLHACIIAGDETELAKRLQLPTRTVVEYVLGEVPIPTNVFLKAADIVLQQHGQQIRESSELLYQIRERHRNRPLS